MRAPLAQLEQAIRVNVEGTGLLLQHCRKAKAALIVSSQGVYSPHPDPMHLYAETDPVGRANAAACIIVNGYPYVDMFDALNGECELFRPPDCDVCSSFCSSTTTSSTTTTTGP